MTTLATWFKVLILLVFLSWPGVCSAQMSDDTTYSPFTGELDKIRDLDDLDDRYVNETGDTMTGNLIMDDGAGAPPTIRFKDGADNEFYLFKNSGSAGGLVSHDDFYIMTDGDTSDYLIFSTDSNTPEILTSDRSDLKITPDGGSTIITGDLGVGIDPTLGYVDVLGHITARKVTDETLFVSLGYGITSDYGYIYAWDTGSGYKDISLTGNNVLLRADTHDGSTKVKFVDDGDNEVAYVDSDGNSSFASITSTGTIEGATLTEGGNAVYHAGDNEVIDWTAASAGTIHTDNYIEGHSNGANCAAGSYPLGVDASGAVESCTDATTEINTEIGNVLDGTDTFTDFNSTDIITHADIADADQTDTKCIWFEDPTADDDFTSIWRNGTGNAFLITEIWGESDQTVNFDLVESAGDCGDPVAPAAGEDENTGLSCTISADEEIDLKVNSVSGTPTWVSICFTGNWVD